MKDPGLPKRTVSVEDLDRLKKQREASDSRYDEWLTAVDQALYPLPAFPHPPPLPDEAQVSRFNDNWEILRAKPAALVSPAGWKEKAAVVVWELIEPIFARQQEFNSALVDHLNRNIQPQRETVQSIETTIALLQDQLTALVAFHSTLMQYLQRITPFVNSKDYEFAALARRTYEDGEQQIQSIARTQRALSASIQGLSNELLKQVESLRSHVLRYDGRIESANAAVAIVQQQAAALQREVARLTNGGPDASAAVGGGVAGQSAAVEPAFSPATQDSPAGSSSTLAGRSATESWKYPAFEAAFRGSEADIAERLAGYAKVFASADDVLDVGCGRGEFLDLLRSRGLSVRGVDLNHEMVEICRARGLDVQHGDALSYLRSLPDGSLGGLFAAQVVEHLAPDYLLAFLNEAQRVLQSGAPIVLETINVACWYAFFQSYIRDITHARPLHPETLKYLVIASGFAAAEIEFRVPVPEADRLQAPAEVAWRPTGDDQEAILSLSRTVGEHADTLNKLLFTYLDYAVIARKA
jgi:O-antigen chain-terminating methyltransferase